MNPLTTLTTLDSLLADWASPRVRRLIHAAIALVALVVTALLAADGDWKVAAVSLFATLYAAVNKANTPAVPNEPESDDGLTYEQAGGGEFPETVANPSRLTVDDIPLRRDPQE